MVGPPAPQKSWGRWKLHPFALPSRRAWLQLWFRCPHFRSEFVDCLLRVELRPWIDRRLSNGNWFRPLTGRLRTRQCWRGAVRSYTGLHRVSCAPWWVKLYNCELYNVGLSVMTQPEWAMIAVFYLSHVKSSQVNTRQTHMIKVK